MANPFEEDMDEAEKSEPEETQQQALSNFGDINNLLSDIEANLPPLDNLDLTSQEFLLDSVDSHIQENLEDELVQEALQQGVDLRQYSRQIERDLVTVENESIQDYIKESSNIASLHKQITQCDAVLQRMEDMLKGFQGDLGSISSEIQSLQEKSIAMNVRLKNRQAVRGELSQFVAEMAVPNIMIKHILETSVTQREFLEQLHELNHKISFVKEQSFRDAHSCNDVEGILEKLRIKALSKIREFLLDKINQFRKPMTNYQIPQNAMLKYRFFNEFLIANERHVAREIKDTYVDTVSKIYFSYFKSYYNRLMKLQFDEMPDRDDLMAVEDTARRSFFSSKSSLRSRSTVFTLGQRANVLQDLQQAPIIVPHVAQKQDHSYPYEALFRSLQFALVDNCSREFLFLCDFFMVSGAAALELFNAVMSKTVNLYLKNIDGYLTDCFDCLALFLCIQIIHRFRLIMEQRSIPALDMYWQGLLNIASVRFEYVLQLNIQSVKDCDPATLNPIDTRPHYIARRYAEFSSAITGLNRQFHDQRTEKLLLMLQSEVDAFLNRLRAELPRRKDQLICTINNYDMMLSVSSEQLGDDTNKDADWFQKHLAESTDEYVDALLEPHFEGLMKFVQDCEAPVEQNKTEILRSQERRAIQITQHFNNSWRKAVDDINGEVMQSFTNFKNGTQILQTALMQLVQYYHRFQRIVSHAAFKNLRDDVINVHQIMHELRKYKTNF